MDYAAEPISPFSNQPFDLDVSAQGMAGAPQHVFLLVDADLVIRASGGGTGAGGTEWCGRRLDDVMARGDDEFQTMVRHAIATGASASRRAELHRGAETITLDVDISGILDQSGQRMAAMWGTVGPVSPDPRGSLSLSDREAEILELAGQGLRVATIARALYISPSTVRNHLSSIFRKAGVRNQAELLEWLRAVPGPIDRVIS